MVDRNTMREAARHLTQLQTKDLSVKDAMEWQQWLAQDPRHSEEFKRMEELWRAYGDLPKPALLREDVVEADTYDGSVPVAEWQAQQALAPRRRARWRTPVWAMAATLLLAVAAWLTWSYVGIASQVLSTAIAENRSFTLQDGSQVTLGGDSRVSITFGDSRRAVRLLKGEALFSVAKDTHRPFTVRAGSAEVTAVGTAFNIRRNTNQVVVSVIEGRVNVQPLRLMALIKGDPKPLDAGAQAVVTGSSVGKTVALQDQSAAVSWQSGRLSFDDEPLGEVLEVVNRYSAQRIEIEDREIAELRFSGTVVSGHIDSWIVSLRPAFGIQSTARDGRVVLMHAR